MAVKEEFNKLMQWSVVFI
uniref:Uncharacterized protein n=1 Tax=Rhizophora mucronata TaxID=61149 RepID=A0A2P2MVV0_RHIMU